MTKDLELMPQQSAHIERELGGIIKDVHVFNKGVRKAGAEMYGYTFLKGMRLLRAKELVPHGNFIPWCESQFPDDPHRTLTYAMNFAEEMKTKLATIANLKKPLLLLGGSKISGKDRGTILNIVPEMMGDNGSIAEFMRASKMLRDPKPKKFHAPKKPSPAELAEAELEQAIAEADSVISAIALLLEGETLTRISKAKRNQLSAAFVRANKAVGELSKGK